MKIKYCKGCKRNLPKEKVRYITEDLDDNKIEVEAMICSNCGGAHYETDKHYIFEYSVNNIKDTFDTAMYVKSDQEVAKETLKK